MKVPVELTICFCVLVRHLTVERNPLGIVGLDETERSVALVADLASVITDVLVLVGAVAVGAVLDLRLADNQAVGGFILGQRNLNRRYVSAGSWRNLQ